MPSKTITTLLFDLGNVILDIDVPATYSAFEKIMTPSITQVRIDEIVNQYESGLMSNEIFINSFLAHAQTQTQAVDIMHAWNTMLIGSPVARLEMLAALKSNYSVYLLSNTNDIHLQWFNQYYRQQHKIDFEKDLFHKAFFSHTLKDRKPNASAFEKVIEATGLIPEETLFMDDLEKNIETAKRIGFQTHLVEKEEDIVDVLIRMGIYQPEITEK